VETEKWVQRSAPSQPKDTKVGSVTSSQFNQLTSDVKGLEERMDGKVQELQVQVTGIENKMESGIAALMTAIENQKEAEKGATVQLPPHQTTPPTKLHYQPFNPRFHLASQQSPNMSRAYAISLQHPTDIQGLPSKKRVITTHCHLGQAKRGLWDAPNI
jgi:hypothetical protein